MLNLNSKFPNADPDGPLWEGKVNSMAFHSHLQDILHTDPSYRTIYMYVPYLTCRFLGIFRISSMSGALLASLHITSVKASVSI